MRPCYIRRSCFQKKGYAVFARMKRMYWFVEYVDDKEKKGSEFRWPTSRLHANRISSLTEDDLHAPVIDVDLPIRVIPSSTPGHYHLYIDKKMSWKAYRKLLKALVEAGLVEENWYKMSLRRRMTMVRPPHLRKKDDPDRRSVPIHDYPYVA